MLRAKIRKIRCAVIEQNAKKLPFCNFGPNKPIVEFFDKMGQNHKNAIGIFPNFLNRNTKISCHSVSFWPNLGQFWPKRAIFLFSPKKAKPEARKS